MTRRVLVVDDNEDIYKSLRINIIECDYQALWVETGAMALRAITENEIDVVLLDLSLGAENGIDVLEDIQGLRPGLPVIIITGYGTFEKAVKAVKLGAFDFLEKPLDFDHLFAVVEKAIRLSAHNSSSFAEMDNLLLTKNSRMLALCQRAKRLAATNIPILITGESGTGKELLAEFIHRHSPRRDKPFVRVNCSVLTESLVNSELFGHEKGAFTGAGRQHIGFFEQAHGGSLHLDEIGDMSMANQAKILRVIEDFKLRRLGGSEDIPIDVRIIAATNKNIEDLIEVGAFRQDLLFRLNAVLLYLPPLREREGDLEFLSGYFLREFSGGRLRRFSTEAWSALNAYSWPGNVRELRNVVKVGSVVAETDEIGIGDLPAGLASAIRKSGRLNEVEREAIARALDDSGGNKSLAASRLGITRRTLYKKMERYGLSWSARKNR